jgi:DNA-binding response OmpR family regulator
MLREKPAASLLFLNLRKKLREVDGNDDIESVWGIGFKLK